jgi:hypothetical protein
VIEGEAPEAPLAFGSGRTAIKQSRRPTVLEQLSDEANLDRGKLEWGYHRIKNATCIDDGGAASWIYSDLNDVNKDEDAVNLDWKSGRLIEDPEGRSCPSVATTAISPANTPQRRFSSEIHSNLDFFKFPKISKFSDSPNILKTLFGNMRE